MGKLEAKAGGGQVRGLVLRKNDFPYNLGRHEHLILWKVEGGGLEEREIEEEVRRLEAAGEEVVWWINPPQLKSVRDLDHAHVIVRRS